jgi:hypothetical protein
MVRLRLDQTVIAIVWAPRERRKGDRGGLEYIGMKRATGIGVILEWKTRLERLPLVGGKRGLYMLPLKGIFWEGWRDPQVGMTEGDGSPGRGELEGLLYSLDGEMLRGVKGSPRGDDGRGWTPGRGIEGVVYPSGGFRGKATIWARGRSGAASLAREKWRGL